MIPSERPLNEMELLRLEARIDLAMRVIKSRYILHCQRHWSSPIEVNVQIMSKEGIAFLFDETVNAVDL